MISIPIEIGDIILAGRFKNKKIQVKEIGTDDYGLPTINGRGIMKIRVQKMMPKKEELLRKMVREEIQRLSELDVTDPELEKKIEEYARMADEMKRLKNEMAELQKKYEPLDNELTQLIEGLSDTEERALRTKNILVTVERKGYERASFQYKEAFEYLYGKVNGKMKELANEAKEATKKISTIATSISSQRLKPESKLNEGNFLSNLFNKLKSFILTKLAKFQSKGKEIDSDLTKLEKLARR